MESVRPPAGKLVNFLFLQTKTIREDPEKERSSSWRSFCMFPPAVNAPSPEKVNKNGHLWDNPVE